MIRAFTYLATAFIFLSLGIWYGYDKGIMNQIYFDAPAKVALYNAVLEKGSTEEFLEGAIIQELGILEGMESEAIFLLLNHPTHAGMEEAFLKYRSSIETLPRVKEARSLIETYNKTRNDMDGSDEPPIR